MNDLLKQCCDLPQWSVTKIALIKPKARELGQGRGR